MYLLLHLFTIFSFIKYIRLEIILLPSTILTNQSFTSVYFCYLHQLNNSKELFLQNYKILNDKNTNNIHHLLVYECSIQTKLFYSGLCGMYNSRLMPELVYRHCQTRIIIAWAKGGQLQYTYPIDTGLKFDVNTQLLLEVHFEPFILTSYSIGIQLEFFQNNQKPKYEIGVLTLGTLAKSSLYLPLRLKLIRFPTYCFNDCLKSFLKNNIQINIFSILLHAHHRAKRIILEDNYLNRLIDKNPFEYHRQEIIYFNSTYPKINSTHELYLTCYYSTENDYFNATYGGFNSNDEMCQAFIYYYPKISLFPLCLSLPVYNKQYNNINNWTIEQSLLIKNDLESNKNHLSICGDNNFLNQTMLKMKIYQRSIKSLEEYLLFSSYFYFLIIFLSIICFYLIIKTHLHCFSNGGTL